MRKDADEAFRKFVAARGQALLRTAYLLVGNAQDAEDLLQTVLARTYVAWPRLDAVEAAESYVRVALGRAATRWWRRRGHEVLVADVPDKAVVPPDAAAARDEMWKHLLALPPRQRAVLVLRYYEDMSEAQIASALRCSTGTVKSQASKALQNLRREWSGADAAMIEGESR